MMYYSLLPDRVVLAVSGEDARDFLQGLVTKDMRNIGEGKAVFAALLSPQGRFLFDFFVIEKEGRFLLETDKDRLPDLVKRLTMYRLRSKVNFEVLDMQVAAAWEKDVWGQGPHDSTTNCQIAYDDPRPLALGWRMLFGASEIPAFAGMTANDYDSHRLSLGVPEGAKDIIVDRSIILEYGYDELGAVDFDKGCYVGQEVTARSKHRATLRKFIHQVRAESPLPPKGTPVMRGAQEAGTMASSAGNIGLAHLRVEEVLRAARENTPLTAGGIALEAKLPQWCRTSFADGVLSS